MTVILKLEISGGSAKIGSMKGLIKIGVDTGGTFTDFVYFRDGKIMTGQVPSTPVFS